MFKRNECLDILIENATSYTEKAKIYALTEAEQAKITDRMIGNLYQSALKRKNVDFGDIPNSKGNIQKVGGYDNMVATIEMLKVLTKKFGIKIPELIIVEDAVNNLRVQQRVFEKAYNLNIDFLKMFYQSLVLAAIDATTLLLASYVEFTRTPNNIEFKVKSGRGISGGICIESLDKFNKSIKDGSFNKFSSGLLNKKQENMLGAAAVAVSSPYALPAIMIGASLVPILRGLLFYFYDAKMSLSEKLHYQAELLNMNKSALDSSSMDAIKRNKVLDKQQKYMSKLEKLSDKILVTNKIANKSSSDSIRQDNKNYNISGMANNEDDFTFI